MAERIKKKNLNIRITLYEYEILKEYAEKKQLNLSEAIRTLIREIERRG